MSASGDINADNRPDTVIIYSIPGGLCQFLAVLNLISGYQLTDYLPAPQSYQKINFIEYYGKPPLDVTISGENDGNVGLGIFRLENNEFVSVFGSNYINCCGAAS
jgi:hypothetical protein